jgi:flagellar hook-associated protein 3 FlgL
MMRITNNIMQQEMLRGMQRQSKQMLDAQRRATSGLRIERASDDPIAASASMHTRRELRALTQYQRNIDIATGRLNAEEGALDALGNTLVRARELAIAARGPAGTGGDYGPILKEVEQLLQHAVALGNTRFGDEYLFGGHEPGLTPFRLPAANEAEPGDPTDPTDPDPLPGARFLNHPDTPPSGLRQTEISAGRIMRMNHDGQEVFLDTGALQALANLADALREGDDAAIGEAMDSLDSAHRSLQGILGDVGARANQLQMTTANLRALEVNLQTFKSNLEEVDFEKAVTELITRQTAYQAAMAATSRVIGMTLTDYLR